MTAGTISEMVLFAADHFTDTNKYKLSQINKP